MVGSDRFEVELEDRSPLTFIVNDIVLNINFDFNCLRQKSKVKSQKSKVFGFKSPLHL